ncbi:MULTISPECIES: flavin reductase family protein [unclassified Streptomyces]|uniref:flavin reductase family protein n=1 Tax=unclassified Streptomyces TaxID=2593676 RepID=UPI0022587802|nr:MULTISPECIES: flavin reductase family protein [unclassified Streptomyces]MCX5062387.1 flavin reductase family protein [Streptomyces sp. NBC_00452]MCX5292005.1 flavin reductase family protein [Streptomyces sp. NBC_00183]
MTDTGGTLLAEPATELAAFRAAMGRFPTGVTLLTQGSGDDTIVMTLNSLTSVSLDPMLLLVSVKSDGRMRPRIVRGGGFAVNVLSEQQRDLAQEFCRPDRPAGRAAMLRLGADEGTLGHAVVPSAEAYFECELHDQHEAGDHVLLVGRVVALHDRPGEAQPLLFHRGAYAQVGAGRAA